MSNHEAYIMEQLSHAPDEMSRAYELTLTRMMTASDMKFPRRRKYSADTLKI